MASPTPCYSPPTVEKVVIAVVLIVGGIVSYLPQYRKIAQKGTSYGLSYLTNGAALASSACTGVNAGILSWHQLTCCAEMNLSGPQCIANNLSLLQLIVVFLLNYILMFMFVRYCLPHPDEPSFLPAQARAMRRRAGSVLALITFAAVTVAIASLVAAYAYHVSRENLVLLAKVVGYTGAVIMSAQYLPQIYTTFVLGGAGALSEVTLLMQLPGTLLVIYFQAVLSHADVSTWLPFVANSTEMAILLGMLLYFRLRVKLGLGGVEIEDVLCGGADESDEEEKEQRTAAEFGVDRRDTEQTPLLA